MMLVTNVLWLVIDNALYQEALALRMASLMDKVIIALFLLVMTAAVGVGAFFSGGFLPLIVIPSSVRSHLVFKVVALLMHTASMMTM